MELHRNQDAVWQYLQRDDSNPNKAFCTFCGHIFTSSIVTDALYHLAKIEINDIAACMADPRTNAEYAEAKRRCMEIVEVMFRTQAIGSNAGSHSTTKVGGGISTPAVKKQTMTTNQEKQDAARKFIAKFWYKHMLPLSCFDDPDMQKMLDLILEAGTGLKIPTYHEVQNSMLDAAYTDFQNTMITHRDAWAVSGCSILVDEWVDRYGQCLINIFVGSARGTLFLRSIDASGKMNDDAACMFSVFSQAIEHVGPQKVVQIVTKNTNAYVAAGAMIEKKYTHVCWSPCAVHCLDLLLEDIGKLRWIWPTIRKAQYISKFIYAHGLTHELMRMHTKNEELAKPGATKFATNFIMLQRFLKYKCSLMRMFISDEWQSEGSTSYEHLRNSAEGKYCKRVIFDDVGFGRDHSRSFWYVVSLIVKITEPIVKLLQLVYSTKGSIRPVYHCMKLARSVIQVVLNTERFPGRAKQIDELIAKRWDQMARTNLYAAAHILNPEHGYGQMIQIDADVKLRTAMYKVLERIVPGQKATEVMIIEELDKYKRGDAFDSGDVDVLSEGRMAAEKIRPDVWWEVFGFNMRALSKIALRILTQPCASSGCEPNSSVSEHIHSRLLNRLAHDRMSKQVYIYFNSRLCCQERNMEDSKNLASALDMDLGNVGIDTPLAEWLFDKPDMVCLGEVTAINDAAFVQGETSEDKEADAVVVLEDPDAEKLGGAIDEVEVPPKAALEPDVDNTAHVIGVHSTKMVPFEDHEDEEEGKAQKQDLQQHMTNLQQQQQEGNLSKDVAGSSLARPKKRIRSDSDSSGDSELD